MKYRHKLHLKSIVDNLENSWFMSQKGMLFVLFFSITKKKKSVDPFWKKEMKTFSTVLILLQNARKSWHYKQNSVNKHNIAQRKELPKRFLIFIFVLLYKKKW